jgi:hypothetical protein
MNQRQRFIRKIIYACAIAALLLPLFRLSQPETRDAKGDVLSQGGTLAQMRNRYKLSQSTLGEIDPASETIKLATLGMRGVAANILWEKANYYKKTEDWSSLSATLEQIAKLQPNFVSVWIYQGWNLSYNISVEFDDYRDRYYWVIKGINFLKEGTAYNDREPRLLSEVGYTIAHKIGGADEKLQFRRLFRDDDEFNGALPRSQRDNWLVGREWQLKAQQLVDEKGVPLRGKSPLLFYVEPSRCLISYAEALEEDGTFGEVAKTAWRKAADSWTSYSNRDLPSRYNFPIRLNEKEVYVERSKKAQAELEKLAPPGEREKILAEKLDALSSQERAAYDTPDARRSPEQREMMYPISQKLRVEHAEVADRVQGENHAAALRAAAEATYADQFADAIDIERGIVNYDYWQLRCRVEPNDDTLEARKAVYDGDQAFLAAQLVKSKELYDKGWEKWAVVLKDYPELLNDQTFSDELIDSISHYRSVLHQLDEKFPQPFILQSVVDADVKFHGPRVGATPGETAQQADTPSQPQADGPATPDEKPQ